MKISKLTLIVVGFAIVLAVGLQAALADTEEAATDVTSSKTCFWLSQINDFRSLDNRHVWLKGVGKDDQYLLTLFSSCTGLPFAQSIALSTRPTQRLCSNANEHLILIDQGVGNRRCMISNVERVENLDAARELVAKREEEKKQQADAQE